MKKTTEMEQLTDAQEKKIAELELQPQERPKRLINQTFAELKENNIKW